MNAASGVASTLSGIISQFSHTILAAFNPQIVKRYAGGDIKVFTQLIISASKYSTLLVLLIIVPFEFEVEQVLFFWLGQIPDYTVSFSRLMMLSLLTCATNPVYIGLTANGNIKVYSLIQAFFYLLSPFVSYYLCVYFNIPQLAYLIVIGGQFIVSVLVVVFLKKKVATFNVTKFIRVLILTVLIPACVSILLCYLIYSSLNQSIIRLLVIAVANMSILSLSVIISMNSDERYRLKSILKKKLTGLS